MPEIKVLLVEDSDTDAMLFRVHLGSDGRFSVMHVVTLAAACDALRNGDGTDVVALDLNLPDAIGIETFTSLHTQFPDVPVVILSGQDDEELAVAAVAQGAQDYLPKNDVSAPLLVRTLLYAIERNGRQLAERRNVLMQVDLDKARQIQEHLLPKEPPTIAGFDIAGVCQPAEQCSGDSFDFIELGDGRWDLLVADVSSHGFAPALIMVGARRLLRTIAQSSEDLGKILTTANRALAEDTLEQFVTMFYSRLDPANQTLTYAAAGHPVWMLDEAGEATTLKSSDIPLGLQSDCEYRVAGCQALKQGDIVLLLTDGAYEAVAPGGEQFGQQRILDFIHQHREQPAAEILDKLLAEITRFCQPGAPRDDVTVVLVKVVG